MSYGVSNNKDWDQSKDFWKEMKRAKERERHTQKVQSKKGDKMKAVLTRT